MSNINSAVQAVINTVEVGSKGLIKFKKTYVQEAVARGFGFRTWAACCRNEEPLAGNFDPVKARDRMRELSRLDADAFHAVLLGVRLSLTATKRQPQPGFPDTTIFDVRAEIKYADGAGPDPLATFVLPSFAPRRENLSPDIDLRTDSYLVMVREFQKHGEEVKYQVDSNYPFRLGDREVDRWLEPDGSTRIAKFCDGQWEGALFIYNRAAAEQAESVLKTAFAALARNMLAAVSPGVRVLIYAPRGYQFGAWKVLITLGPSALSGWQGSSPSFSVPRIKNRSYKPKEGYIQAVPGEGDSPYRVTFKGGVFMTGISANELTEDINPSRLINVKDALIDSVERALDHMPLPADQEQGELMAH